MYADLFKFALIYTDYLCLDSLCNCSWTCIDFCAVLVALLCINVVTFLYFEDIKDIF